MGLVKFLDRQIAKASHCEYAFMFGSPMVLSCCCFALIIPNTGCEEKATAVRPAPKQSLSSLNWQPIQGSHIRYTIQSLGHIPNSGLQLPVVSPDGTWIAFLETGGQVVPPSALLNGTGLEAVSISIRRLVGGDERYVVCPVGGAWPVFSRSGRQLIYIAYDQSRSAAIEIYDLRSRRTRRIDPGLVRIIMPTAAPTAGLLAIAAREQFTSEWQCYLLNVNTGSVVRAPNPQGEGIQLWPQWLDARKMIYVETQRNATFLTEWSIGTSAAQMICRLNSQALIGEIFGSLVNLGASLSPDRNHFAYYDAGQDTITLVDIKGSQSLKLKGAMRTGCWLDEKRFLAGNDEGLWIVEESGDLNRVIKGAWLPRWVGSDGSVIACGEGPDPDTFELVRLRLLPAGGDAADERR